MPRPVGESAGLGMATLKGPGFKTERLPNTAGLPISATQWDNTSHMQTLFTRIVSVAAAAMLWSAAAVAQDAPAVKTPQAPPAKTSTSAPAKAKAPAAKKPAASAPLTLKTEKDKFSYGLGMSLGMNIVKQGADFDPAIFSRGLKDAIAGGKTLLTEEDARAAITAMQEQIRGKQLEKAKLEGEANKKEGADFLAANKAKEGVVTLPSGLQYKVLTEGTGPKPTAADTVVCNYRGAFINGKEFDSSFRRGEPATFPVSGVIKGWTEALQLMPAGSKWQLFIPSDLAYGERGMPPDIGPAATLIFEVELVGIQPKEQPKEPAKDQKEPAKEPQKP